MPVALTDTVSISFTASDFEGNFLNISSEAVDTENINYSSIVIDNVSVDTETQIASEDVSFNLETHCFDAYLEFVEPDSGTITISYSYSLLESEPEPEPELEPSSSAIAFFLASNFHDRGGVGTTTYSFSASTNAVAIENIDYSSIEITDISSNSSVEFENLAATFNLRTHRFEITATSTETGDGYITVSFNYSLLEPEPEPDPEPDPDPEPEETILNRRLKLNEAIVYPITRQENIIGLQSTIKEKLPIISETEPETGFVNRQAWLDISEEEDLDMSISLIENNYGRTTRSIPRAATITNYGSVENNFNNNGDEIEDNFGNNNSDIEDNYEN